MENKKLLELNDDDLNAVSGGAFGDWETCPACGKPKREGISASIVIWKMGGNLLPLPRPVNPGRRMCQLRHDLG